MTANGALSCQVRGGRPLYGTVRIAGFKHALVSVLAGAVAVGDRVRLANVPDVEDTRVLVEAIRRCGGHARHDRGDGVLDLDLAGMTGAELPPELSGRVHGSLYLVPGLLARCGRVRAAGFGGCRIGAAAAGGERPLHHVAEVLERFGARVRLDGDELVATADTLVGTDIDLREFMSDPVAMTGPLYSGATKTAILAAAGAEGRSVLRHPYPKPDVTELIASLAAAGLRADRGPDALTIHGTGRRRARYRHRLPADVLEALTFLTAALHVSGRLRLSGVAAADLAGMAAERKVLEAMGVLLDWTPDGELTATATASPLRARDLVVASRGVFSDAQPFLTLLLTGADGPATVRDTVWESRFQYAAELVRLGADISVASGEARVHPRRPTRTGATLTARDVRGAAVLVLAALGVDGVTTIHGVEHLARGYDDLFGKLTAVGADITVTR
ncbi:MAG TPA: hypothetical protein VFU43_27795 [Streptosporangiaceae bacterium]|nr:hypothetical protein [Streptosporangiaceae bacterium]